MKLEFLGACGEVGRSALLVNDTLLIDFGIKPGDTPRYPLRTPSPSAVLVSHGHLDHAGLVPTLLSGTDRPPIHLTPPTLELTRLLATDTLGLYGGRYDCPFTHEEVARLSQAATTHPYHESFHVESHEITFYNAGHIPGSAHIRIDDGEQVLLYTGDYHTIDQRLVPGSTDRPSADIIVTESTYHDVDHDPRSELEERFAKSVKATIWEGGTVVIPAFAIGRTQELLMICDAYDIPCYVDGLGTDVTSIFTRHSSYIRDPPALRSAVSRARQVTGRNGQRERIAAQNTAIVTTSGMLSGGPAMTYLPAVLDHPRNKITLTGYQVAGTPGRELLDSGSLRINDQIFPVSAQVEQYDFSAHADRTGLRAFLTPYSDEKILVVHGEQCETFAAALTDDGYAARAPRLGETMHV